jgi:hypothetical protein
MQHLCTVHFPDCRSIDRSTDREGLLNLGEFSCKTNGEDWNLAKSEIDQSKIKWATNISIPFKSEGTDDIVPAHLQYGV